MTRQWPGRRLTRLLLPIWLLPVSAAAQEEWSGVRVDLAETDIEWNFDGGKREASISRVSFEIEGTAGTGLIAGFGLGYMSVSLRSGAGMQARRFDAEYFEVFLRQPFDLGDHFRLHAGFDYRYNSGRDRDEDHPADIDWTEVAFEVGAGWRLTDTFRVTPFARYYSIDGDLDEDIGGVESFDLDDPVSGGIRFDYFVEETAFVRFEYQTGEYAGGYLIFAREYF